MPTIPTVTLEQRIARIRADINAVLVGADAGIRRSVEQVVGNALAAVTHELQGLLLWVSRQGVPGPDSEPETLERWLLLFSSPRKQPSPATGQLKITGTVSTAVAALTQFQLADGTIFETDALATIVDNGGGDISITTAVTAADSGAIGNAVVGTILTLVSPVAGVDSDATVVDDGDAGGLTTGTDLETRDEMWTRLRIVIANPAGHGNDGDYERWALEVEGVTRAWTVSTGVGVGRVLLLFVMDARDNIIPLSADEAIVQATIDALRPVNVVEFLALGPTKKDISFSMSGIPDLTVQENVTTSLKDLIIRKAEPGVTITLEQMIGAIAIVAGTDGFSLVSPVVDATHTALEIPVFLSAGYV